MDEAIASEVVRGLDVQQLREAAARHRADGGSMVDGGEAIVPNGFVQE